jgi:ubiquitin C-terminal hydrolase
MDTSMTDWTRDEIIEQLRHLNCPFNSDQPTDQLWQLLARTELSQMLNTTSEEAVTVCLHNIGQMPDGNEDRRKSQLLDYLLVNPDQREEAVATLTEYNGHQDHNSMAGGQKQGHFAATGGPTMDLASHSLLSREEVSAQLSILGVSFHSDHSTKRLQEQLFKTRLNRLIDNTELSSVTKCLSQLGIKPNSHPDRRRRQLTTYIQANTSQQAAIIGMLVPAGHTSAGTGRLQSSTPAGNARPNRPPAPDAHAAVSEQGQCGRQNDQHGGRPNQGKQPDRPHGSSQQSAGPPTGRPPNSRAAQQHHQQRELPGQQAGDPGRNDQDTSYSHRASVAGASGCSRQSSSQSDNQPPGRSSSTADYRQPLPKVPYNLAYQMFEKHLEYASDGRILAIMDKFDIPMAESPCICDSIRKFLLDQELPSDLLQSIDQDLDNYSSSFQYSPGGTAGPSYADMASRRPATASYNRPNCAGDSRPATAAVVRLTGSSLHLLSLQNSGNFCYSNTGFIVLDNVLPFRSLLLKATQQLGPIGTEMRRLMMLQKGSTQSLTLLRRLVADSLRTLHQTERIAQDYDGPRQHDVSEFLNSLIYALTTEQSPISEALVQLFYGLMSVTYVCTACNYIAGNNAQQDTNAVTLVPINHTSLTANMAELLDGKLFNGDCGSCHAKNVPMYEVKTLLQQPQVRLMAVNRFLSGPTNSEKLDTPVSVDQELKLGDATYRLHSFINHRGEEAVSGHYTVTLFDSQTKRYTECDDGRGFMQATHTGLRLNDTDVLQSYITCYVMGPSEPTHSPPAKRRCSFSHAVYSPVANENDAATRHHAPPSSPPRPRQAAGAAKPRSKQQPAATRDRSTVPATNKARAESQKQPAKAAGPVGKGKAQSKSRQSLLSSRQPADQPDGSGITSPPGDLLTGEMIGKLSRATIESLLGSGFDVKQTTKRLQAKLLLCSVTACVGRLTDDAVRQVLVQMQISIQNKPRWRNYLCRFYVQNALKQDQIKSLLLAATLVPDLPSQPEVHVTTQQDSTPMEMDDALPTADTSAAVPQPSGGGADQLTTDPMEVVNDTCHAAEPMPNGGDETNTVPEIATFPNDFYPSDELAATMDANFAQLRNYRAERADRINNNNSSLENMPPNPILEAGHVMHEQLAATAWRTCAHCNESRLDLELAPRSGKCKACQRARGAPRMFSAENDMHACMPPAELDCLNTVEQMCVSRIVVQIHLYKLFGHSVRQKGHCIAFYQDLDEFSGLLTDLPSQPADLPLLIVPANDQSRPGLTANRGKILRALIWLRANNRYYRDITINYEALKLYPDDDTTPVVGLRTVKSNEADNASAEPANLSTVYTREEDTPDMTFTTVVVAENRATEQEVLGHDLLGHSNVPANVRMPSRSTDPVSEFTEGYFAMAFPTLPGFCRGECDITVPRLGRNPPFKAYISHLLKHPSRRFIEHPTFLLIMGNRYLRTTALSLANVYAKQLDSSMTMAELRARVAADDQTVIQKLLAFSRTVPGSRQFWQWKRGQAYSLVDWVHHTSDMQETFNVFLTLSFSDNHIPELHRLLDPNNTYIDKIVVRHELEIPATADPNDYITASKQNRMRAEAIADQPDVASEFLHKKLALLKEHVLIPCLGAIDWIIRCEFQHRSSEHFHMVLRLKDGLSRQTIETAFRKYGFDVAALSGDEPVRKPGEPSQAQVLRARADVMNMAVHRVGLMANHPELNRSNWPEPEGDRSNRPDSNCLRQSYTEAMLHQLPDLIDLVNRLQLHSCSKGYCRQLDKTGKELPCKQKYPRKLVGYQVVSADETLVVERIPDVATLGASFQQDELQVLRNHPRLVMCIHEVLQTWRANNDAQLIESTQQLIAYILKYVMKAEVGSVTWNDLVKKVTADTDDECPVRKLFGKVLMMSVTEHDYSRSECVRLFDTRPLVEMSRQFVSVNLLGTRQVNTADEHDRTDQSQRPSTKPNRADNFWTRHDDPNFLLLVADYESGEADLPRHPTDLSLYQALGLFNDRWHRWQELHVPHCTPQFWTVPKPTNLVQRPRYLRSALLLHDPHCLPADLPDDVAALELRMSTFVQNPLCPLKIRQDYRESLKTDDDKPPTDERAELNPSPANRPTGPLEQDDWMLLMGGQVEQDQMNCPDTDDALGQDQDDLDAEEENIATDETADWQADRLELGHDNASIKADANWISTMKDTTDIPQDWSADHSPDNLNPAQRQAFEHIRSLITGTGDSDRRLVCVLGEAGTGKSEVIKTIQKWAYDTQGNGLIVRVAAFTNSAASHFVGGQTLHRLFRIDVSRNGKFKYRDLDGARLAELQAALSDCRVLIIDEMSFVGQAMLYAVHKRCCQAKPHSADLPFGGLTVILCGDPTQLPPVTDPALYCKPGKTPEEAQGRSLYTQFNTNFVLKQSMRQDGAVNVTFRQQLKNLSIGRFSRDDWEEWSERTFDRLPAAEKQQFVETATLLCARRKDSVDFNLLGLKRTGQPLLVIQATHEGGARARTFPANQLGGLTKNLPVASGARIVLTANLWPDAGLVNGAQGTLQYIVFSESAGPPTVSLPALLVCHFPAYKGPSYLPERGDRLVPIYPVRREHNEGKFRYARTSMPLLLGYSMTIHKSQGVTMPRIMINLGPREFACGLTYTAVSRVRSLTDLAFYPFPNFARIDRLKLHNSFKLLRIDIAKREAAAADFAAAITRDEDSDQQEVLDSNDELPLDSQMSDMTI